MTRYKATLTLDVYYEDSKNVMNKQKKSQLVNDLLSVVDYADEKGYLTPLVKDILITEWYSAATVPTTEFNEELPENVTRWNLKED